MDADAPYTVEDLAKDHEESIIFYVEDEKGNDDEKIISFMVARTEFPRVPAVGETIQISLERKPGSPVTYEPYQVAKVTWFVRIKDVRGKDGTLSDLRVALRKVAIKQ